MCIEMCMNVCVDTCIDLKGDPDIDLGKEIGADVSIHMCACVWTYIYMHSDGHMHRYFDMHG